MKTSHPDASAATPAAPLKLDFDTRKALLFALAAERLSAYYEHRQWMTDAQGSTLAGLWLSRSRLQLALAERRLLSQLSDQFARQLAGTLSREAGLYTAHEMMEALDPNYQSAFAHDLLDECERLLRENGVTE
ncbi:hypothetical protein ACU4GI_23550 [Cupriavidus basilensis]|uniref:hypothetical protein n=1 Tax=Cupriavidus TaxID=106589 RepID=UPI0004516BFD|nr:MULTISPECIES: hypothetical protein [Cupriavidus]KDP88769.1 hypothetical protein CF70_028405 [Cupriavidus sp. SK-3]MDF3882875.1 hypothetical protein [Cupriavidus basilensis]